MNRLPGIGESMPRNSASVFSNLQEKRLLRGWLARCQWSEKK
jgi:hypothetical protein